MATYVRVNGVTELFKDLRFYWLIPLIIGLYALLGKPNTPGFIFPAFCASIACGIALWSAGYKPLSFVSICVLVHAASYPIACFLNLVEASPAVYEYDLWNATPYAMWACSVGMLGLGAGAKLYFHRKRHNCKISFYEKASKIPFLIKNISPRINLLLTLVILPPVLFKLANSFYFHCQVTGIDAFNFIGAKQYAYIGYLELISLSGVFFQIIRYTQTHTKRDGIWAIFLFLIAILFVILSGSRDQVVKIFTLSILAFLAYENSPKLKRNVVVCGILSILILTVAMQIYRYSSFEMEKSTIFERANVLFKATTSNSPKELLFSSGSRAVIARRFADYVATGWFIENVPRNAPFRYFENIQYWPSLAIISFIRPDVPENVLQESAFLASSSSRYGWMDSEKASAPAMILGDLYTRFGWFGIFIGMIVLGVLLRRLDIFFLDAYLWKNLLFVMMWCSGWKTLSHQSLTGIFIFFTRTFVVSGFICLAMHHILILLMRTKQLRYSRGSEDAQQNINEQKQELIEIK